MRILLIFILIALQTACGAATGTGFVVAAPTTTKSLFSTWTTGSKTLNLTGGSFDQMLPINVVSSDGAVCACNAYVAGSDGSGVYGLSQCTYTSGGLGDPGCGSVNGGGSYTNAGATLRICDPCCVDYR